MHELKKNIRKVLGKCKKSNFEPVSYNILKQKFKKLIDKKGGL